MPEKEDRVCVGTFTCTCSADICVGPKVNVFSYGLKKIDVEGKVKPLAVPEKPGSRFRTTKQ
jgi:hypothetical protein